ncbi:MAG: hypothetical protein A2328_10985 [Bdellovibrionales bacterium RIFOXYB2_FULL_36_6]|nr:MAG: hypothetical protein A2328_10985 [Bdellovibrionales bacterium RIFOXYB2_FULL_36_6]
MGDSNILGIKKPIQISQIQSSVRIDVVAMPQQTLLELKAIEKNLKKGEALFKEEPTEIKKIEKTQDIINKDDLVFDKEKKSDNLMSLLKDMSKKDIDVKKRQKEMDVKAKAKEAGAVVGHNLDGELKKLVLRGNQLSQGTGLTGGGDVSGDMTALNLYASGLPDHIRPYWKLPTYLKDKDYMCRIRIYLRPSGSLIKAHIYEASGNEEFDQKALSAVKKAEPFLAVPNDIQSRVSQGDIILGFPL